MRRIFVVFGMFCWIGHLAAQEVQAEWIPDSSSILIGDHLGVTLLIAHDKQTTINWPAFQGNLGKFEILSAGEITRVENEMNIQEQQRLLITQFDSGAYYLPSLALSFMREGDTLPDYAFPDSLPIEVRTVAVDTSQAIKPIKDILAAPITFEELLPYFIMGGIALLLIGLVLYFLVFRKKKEVPVFKPKPVIILPYDQAMSKLAHLEREKLWQAGNIKEYYSQLTEILREYMEGQFKIPALESTTDEIIRDLRDKPLKQSLKSTVGELFQGADLAKFAKFKPGPSENLAAMETARQFVKESRSIPKPLPETESPSDPKVPTS